MSTQRLLSRFTLLPFIGATTYAAAVYKQVSAVPSYNVLVEDSIPPAFRNSKSVRELVNPRNFTATGDAYSTTLEISSRHTDVSDETLLAWYLKGFFESRVFAVERLLLKTFRPTTGITKFSALPSHGAEKHIWNTEDLPEQNLPSLYSRIFGIFQIVGYHLPEEDTEAESREFGVDVGFGSDTARFAGCHRLSIVRTGTGAHMHLLCTSCNPIDDLGLNSGILRQFHKLYAMTLFRAAVARVKRRMEMEEEHRKRIAGNEWTRMLGYDHA